MVLLSHILLVYASLTGSPEHAERRPVQQTNQVQGDQELARAAQEIQVSASVKQHPTFDHLPNGLIQVNRAPLWSVTLDLLSIGDRIGDRLE